MRIVVVTPEAEGFGGGIKTFYKTLLDRWSLSNKSYIYIVVGAGMVAERSETPKKFANNATIITLGIERLNHWRKRFSRYTVLPELQAHLAASWALRELTQELQPDIVEVCDFGLLFASFVCAPIAPYTIQLHGSSGQIAYFDPIRGQELLGTIIQSLEEALVRRAWSLQTYSLTNQLLWREVADVSVTRILPALDAAALNHLPIPTNQAPLMSIFRVFGRLQRWKGVETVAVALRNPIIRDVQVEWYGRDTRFGSIQMLTSRYLQQTFPDVFGDRFVWKAQVPQEQVYALQASALCNLIPSTWDVFNFTVAEAMCSGRPVICSRGAGAAELIETGVNGLLFDAGDSQELAKAMQTIVCMPETERKAMAARAYETVRARLDPQQIAEQRLQVYRDLIQTWDDHPPPLPHWLKVAVSPEEHEVPQALALLDQLSIRALGLYLVQRIRKQILKHS